MNRPSLTDAQLRVFKALNNYIDLHDRVPTHIELSRVLEVGRTTVTVHLATLEDKGYIRRSRKWRDLSLIASDEVTAVPQWERENANA